MRARGLIDAAAATEYLRQARDSHERAIAHRRRLARTSGWLSGGIEQGLIGVLSFHYRIPHFPQREQATVAWAAAKALSEAGGAPPGTPS